jgi:Leucine-rich repeat (LRR) protein
MPYKLGAQFEPEGTANVMAAKWMLVLVAMSASAANLPDAGVAASIEAKGGEVTRDEAGRIMGISLARTWATDNDLLHLLSIKTVKRLDLSFTYVSDRGVELLAQLPALEDLSLDTAEFITDAAASYLRANRGLKRLSLRGTDVTDISVEYLSVLTGLKALDISHTQIGDVGMDHLAAFAELEELSLGGDKISGNSLNSLKLLPHLKKLNFSGLQRRNAGLCWAPAVTDRELDTIGLLTGLEDLDLGAGFGAGTNKAGSGANAGGESQCRVVGGIRVTDIGLAKIAKLKQLKHLNLSGAEITPAGLRELERLTNLEQVSLWNCKALDDAAATVLAGLPKLSVIDLSYTAAGDGALGSLRGMRNLKQLYLTDTKVTADAVGAFRTARPQTFVSWGLRPAPIKAKPASKDASKEIIE